MDGTMGEIRLFAGNFAPVNWAFCDGALQQTADNPALFELLGTTYGGDGRATFALPKLAPPADAPAQSMRYVICVNGIFPARH